MNLHMDGMTISVAQKKSKADPAPAEKAAGDKKAEEGKEKEDKGLANWKLPWPPANSAPLPKPLHNMNGDFVDVGHKGEAEGGEKKESTAEKAAKNPSDAQEDDQKKKDEKRAAKPAAF